MEPYYDKTVLVLQDRAQEQSRLKISLPGTAKREFTFRSGWARMGWNTRPGIQNGRRNMKLRQGSGLIGILAGLAFILCSCSSTPYPEGVYAELETDKGRIVLQLEFEKTPVTVANFVGLAEGRLENAALPLGTPYFDGTVFHRVVPGHVIQAGSPAGEGPSGLGYTIPNEIAPGLGHGRAGMLGMANGGPHTNGSQFYITLGDRSYLDGDYTVFGRVIQGMEVVEEIVQGDIVHEIRIVRVGREARAFEVSEEKFRGMVENAERAVAEADSAKQRKEEAMILSRWPDAEAASQGVRFIILQPGRGEKPGAGLELSYTGQTLDGTRFCSSPDGTPQPGDKAQSFVYEPGKTHVIPALMEAVKTMRPGERRLLIVPAVQAYGNSGFYARQREGEKRFVISPNTTLIYELELLGIK
jgi:peptidylprolyl isomerase